MSRTFFNCYVKFPLEIVPAVVIKDVRDALQESLCFDRTARVQYEPGEP